MPLIDIHVLEGVGTDEEKEALIKETVKGFGKVAGKAMQDNTSARIHKVKKWSLGWCRQCLDHGESFRAKGQKLSAG